MKSIVKLLTPLLIMIYWALYVPLPILHTKNGFVRFYDGHKVFFGKLFNKNFA